MKAEIRGDTVRLFRLPASVVFHAEIATESKKSESKVAIEPGM